MCLLLCCVLIFVTKFCVLFSHLVGLLPINGTTGSRGSLFQIIYIPDTFPRVVILAYRNKKYILLTLSISFESAGLNVFVVKTLRKPRGGW